MLGSEVAQPSPWYSTAKVWDWMPGAYALAIASNVTIALAFQPSKQHAIVYVYAVSLEQVEVQCAWLDMASYAVQTHGISWQLLVLFCSFVFVEKRLTAGSSLRIGKGRRDQAQAPGLFFTFIQFKFILSTDNHPKIAPRQRNTS